MASTNEKTVQILIPTLGIHLLVVLVAWFGGTAIRADDEPLVISGGDGLFVVGEGIGHTAYMGVQLEEDVDDPEGGARVTEVVKESPAEKAGLQVGDVIVGFEGRVIRGPGALTKQIHAAEPGDTVSLEIRRDGGKQSLQLELGERASIWNRLLPDGAVPWATGTGKGFTALDLESLGALKDLEQLRELKGIPWPEGPVVAPRYEAFFDSGRPTLGVQLVETTPELREHLGGSDDAGVIVSKVLAGTPADNAGMEVGDLIVSVAGTEVKNSRELRHALRDKTGETFEIEVIRDGQPRSLEVTIAAAADEPATGPRAYRVAPRVRVKVADARYKIREARRAGCNVI